MSSFSGNFATAAADPGAEIGGALEITWRHTLATGDLPPWLPSSTVMRLSSGIVSARGTSYVPRVIEWGEIQRGFDVRSSSLSPLEMTVQVADDDQALRAALEGGRQRGSAVTVYWVIAGNATDYATRFVGMLDRWGYEGQTVTLTLRTDDRMLRTYPGHTLTKSEWPYIPTPSIGLYAPLVYGTHNSSGLSGVGMLPAICVRFQAGTAAWYVPAIAEAKQVLAVYKNGVIETAGVNYAVSYSYSVAGRAYTIIGFLAGHIPAATDVITCDVRGYESTGNTGSGSTAPTGTLITNPVEQIRHYLINWAEQEYLSGVWATAEDSSVIDPDAWALASQWAERQALEGAGYLGGNAEAVQVGDVLNSWLETWTCFRAYWSATGRLALRVIPLEFQGYRGATDPPLLRTMDERSAAIYEQDTTNLTDRIDGAYLFDEVQGQYLSSLTVTNPAVGEDVTTSVQLPWAIRRAV